MPEATSHSSAPRNDWTAAQAKSLYDLPLTDLLYRAQSVHRQHHAPDAVQLCTLLSIKTGGCPEDCAYCPQSQRYDTGVDSERLMDVEDVLQKAAAAKASGATRFCMGAAWRSSKEGSAQFERVLEMVRGVRGLGMEACVTLGMLTDAQTEALKEAGLTAYNHNIDTSEAYYDKVITTRTFGDRLETVARVAKAGIAVCCGGIIGMGEGLTDRLSMLVTLANLEPQPESLPINALVAVQGTPLGDTSEIGWLEMVKMCALARIMCPKAMVRLSAGRSSLSDEAQMLCFMAGANSIFYGDKLLTTGNPDHAADLDLLKEAGMRALVPSDKETGQDATTEALPPQASALRG